MTLQPVENWFNIENGDFEGLKKSLGMDEYELVQLMGTDDYGRIFGFSEVLDIVLKSREEEYAVVHEFDDFNGFGSNTYHVIELATGGETR